MRFYYMDALRSVLMMLGVVTHSAMVYGAPTRWLIASDRYSPALEKLVLVLQSFRMPAFFIISGFLTGMMLQKYASSRFVRHRLVRLVIPLVCAATLINPWLNALRTDQTHPQGFLAYLFSADYLTDGEWSLHLWFLVNLILYSLLAVVASPLLGRLLGGRVWGAVLRLPGWTALLALGLPLVNMAALRVVWHLAGTGHDAILWGVLELPRIAEHVAPFLVGLAMWHSDALRRAIASARFWGPGLALSCALLWWYSLSDAHQEPRYVEYAWQLMAWGAAGLVLAAFKRFADRPSAIFAYLSEAAYSVYLLHMLFVVAIGTVLVAAGVPAWLGFPLLLLGGAAGSLAVHHYLIRRRPLLGLMFNGKRPKLRGRAAVPARRPA